MRSLALEALHSAGENQLLIEAAADDSAIDVRSAAVRYLGRTSATSPILNDNPPAEVRAEILRNTSDKTLEETLWQAATDADAFIAQAGRQGLLNIGAVSPDIDLAKLSPARRLAALLILREGNIAGGTKRLPQFLRDPDADVRFAAVQWVGEERLSEFREPLVEAVSVGPATARLFGGYLSALERLDGVSRTPSDEWAGEQYVVRALEDPATTPEARRWALRMLRPDHPLLSIERLRGYLAGDDEALKLEAVRSLRDSPHAERDDLLAEIAASLHYSSRLRAEAVVGLSPATTAAKDLLVQLALSEAPIVRDEALRTLRGATLSEDDEAMLAGLADREPTSSEAVARLLVPEEKRALPEAANLDAWVSLLDSDEGESPGDAEAGERIFFHRQAAACARCHQVAGRGARVGPELTATARALDERRLIESIVQPSKEVAPHFVSWLVLTTSGQPLTGVLVHEEATGEQTYADQEGKLTVLKPQDIETRRPLDTSLMPEGLPTQMTVQEFRDLLAFLRGGEGK